MSNKKVKQLKEVPGLLTCMLEHEVTKTSARFTWSGPKIQPELWWQILAFFKWTYEDAHSESQVRLYVNHQTRQWAAWAFPQEAKTGMTSKEIDNEEAKQQREKFKDSEGWLYFGTVHHHCGCSAFQSGVDADNESNQDGLHITVGNMNNPNKHDIHCRLYLCGNRFEPDMSWFWDVEDVLNLTPAFLRKFLPESLGNQLARDAMCIPPPKETEFPAEWKANYIEIKPVRSEFTSQGGMGYVRRDGEDYPSFNFYSPGFRSGKKASNYKRDLRLAVEEWDAYWGLEKLAGDPVGFIKQLVDVGETLKELLANIYRNDVTLEAMLEWYEHELQEQAEEELKRQAVKEAREEAAKEGKTKNNHNAKAKGKGIGAGPKSDGAADTDFGDAEEVPGSGHLPE